MLQSPYYPIIYVRGYAASKRERDDTAATPYMGFNLGSTVLKQNARAKIEKVFFESPLIRLMKEYGYRDVYLDGREILGPLPARSIVIYRYYDPSSRLHGDGRPRTMETLAEDLGDLILRIRDQVCADDEEKRRFKVHLVAHSMGGLVCRTFLQNESVGEQFHAAHDVGPSDVVDKVFTYGTPHNGIDMRGVPRGLVPQSFRRTRMAAFLDLADSYNEARRWKERVDTLDGKFDPDRFFCLVGSNSRDYRVARGMSRRLAGKASDGLVRTGNATLVDAPSAIIHRSHSGYFGLVNSKSGYEILRRFLFGDMRADGGLIITTINPPDGDDPPGGRGIPTSVAVECAVRGRGVDARFDSRDRRDFTSLECDLSQMSSEGVGLTGAAGVKLFTTFLSTALTGAKDELEVGMSLEIRILNPWTHDESGQPSADYFEGSTLLHRHIPIRVRAPGHGENWRLDYRLEETGEWHEAKAEHLSNDGIFVIPLNRDTRPGILAEISLRVSPWNSDDDFQQATRQTVSPSESGPTIPVEGVRLEDIFQTLKPREPQIEHGQPARHKAR